MGKDGRIGLITGSTSGIGKAAAKALYNKGFDLILVARNEDRLQKARRKIAQKTGRNRVFTYRCDLALVSQVREVAAQIAVAHPRIDVLVNNAGARFMTHELTSEGIERTLATNHLGHFVLTLSLIESLERSGAARIINVSSGTQSSARGVIQNIITPERYDGRLQYANSKLANVLFTYALSEKLARTGITVNSVDPGGVATNFARNNGLKAWFKHRLYYLAKRQLLSPLQGSDTIVYLASSDETAQVTGKHFLKRAQIRSSELSYDKALQLELWKLSCDLSGADL